MSQTRKVILYGKSLFIAGLQATLEAVPGFDLQRVEAQPDALRKRMCAWPPDVLILELGAAPCDFGLTLLKEFPSLTLIGVDPESERLLVLSGQSRRALTTDDLLQVIEGHASGLESENEEVTAHMSHRASRRAQVLRPRRKARGKRSIPPTA